MENIEEMQKRHKREIEELQASCKHEKISEPVPFMWAPGHFAGEVRCCENCGKIMATGY